MHTEIMFGELRGDRER